MGVAPLTGCVDWNEHVLAGAVHDGQVAPSRGAWIEINTTSARTCAGTSHPSRGAWIEIDKD